MKSIYCLLLFFLLPFSVLSADYYVSTSGNNSNAGTISSPWRTLTFAVTQISAGDRIYMRGGSYYESNIDLNISGNSSNRIQILNYNGEEVVLDGRIPEFLDVNSNSWEVFNASKNIYRSSNTFPNAEDWMGYLEEGGQFYHLNAYKSLAALSSNDEFWTPSGLTYVGPGVFWNSADEHIYIRLQHPDPAQIYQTFSIPANLDPNQNILHIGLSNRALNFRNANYIDIEGIDMRCYIQCVRIFEGSNISFKNFELWPGIFGLIFDDPNGSDYLIDNIDFQMHLPDWVAWTDMKIDPAPASKMKLTCVALKGSNFEFKNNHIWDTHDGFVGTANNLYIHHNYFETEDDATQIQSSCFNIEFAHNYVDGPGPSHWGSSTVNPNIGSVYMHHNIINSTREHFWARNDPSSLLSPNYRNNPIKGHNIFGSHGKANAANPDPWKIYNNTLIGGEMPWNIDHGYGMWNTNTSGVPHEFYNNIIILESDVVVFRDERVDNGGMIIDGNLYHRQNNSLQNFFLKLADGGTFTNYANLSNFLSSSHFSISQTYYTPGWEANGVIGDPKLDGEHYPASDGLAATGAIDLSNKGWPGATSDTYRGALAPKNINDQDTDGDGALDVQDSHPNNPCLPSQSEGYTGYDPSNSNWSSGDCDHDGTNNGQEFINNTDPYKSDLDSDGDGVLDVLDSDPNDSCLPAQSSGYSGYNVANSIWSNSDCDDDGTNNGQELINNTDPYQSDLDSDGDGMPDVQDSHPNDSCLPEQSLGYTGYNSSNSGWTNADCDGDGTNNGQELINNTDPYLSDLDSDGDGVLDVQDAHPTDPCLPAKLPAYIGYNASNDIWLNADCDGDGTTNGNELKVNTDPYFFNEQKIMEGSELDKEIIFPNPFQDNLNIFLGEEESGRPKAIYIWDLMGNQLMYKVVTVSEAGTISLENLNLSSGSYVLSINYLRFFTIVSK